MQVYLVQHGKAQSKDVDPSRSLTERGRQETERVAALAARFGGGGHTRAAGARLRGAWDQVVPTVTAEAVAALRA